jgi:ATP-dependent Clp protease ATP-binding subunit ClpE
VLDSLSHYFKPEFLNRFDNIIEFISLDKENILHIVDLMLEELMRTLNEQNVTLAISKEAKEKLVELGYHPAFGARPLRRVIQEHLEDNIADALLDNPELKTLEIKVINNEITIESI